MKLWTFSGDTVYIFRAASIGGVTLGPVTLWLGYPTVSGVLLVRWTRISTDQRSFAVYDRRTWNRLPTALRSPVVALFIQAPAQDLQCTCSSIRQCWLQLWVTCTVVRRRQLRADFYSRTQIDSTLLALLHTQGARRGSTLGGAVTVSVHATSKSLSLTG